MGRFTCCPMFGEVIADNGVLALIVTPESAVAAIGSKFDVNCSLDSPEASIIWSYLSNNSNPYATIICKGGEVNYSGR